MHDTSLTILLLFQLFLILLNAVFACTEIAVISVNDNKLKKMAKDGNKRARCLINLTKEPAGFLATIQVGITFAGFLGSAFAADNFSDKIVDFLISLGLTISPQKLDVFAVIFITIILSYITLILGELVPKKIAMQYAEKIALFMAYPIYFIAKIFAPIVWFLTFSTNMVLKILFVKESDPQNSITEEEIRMLIDLGTQNGTIDAQEKKLIHNVFEFDDILVSEATTHRMHVTFLNIDDSLKKMEEKILKTGWSVYPVYKNTYENIIGTIRFKDFFKYRMLDKKSLFKKILRPAQFVPEACHIDTVFKSMQKDRNHFAITVDEYGAITGIITMADLLQKIVGSLNEDTPIDKPLIQEIKENEWLIEGKTPIKTVEKLLKIKFPIEDYDTLGGFILNSKTILPATMLGVQITLKNIYFEVIEAKGHKIETVLVKKINTIQDQTDNNEQKQ